MGRDADVVNIVAFYSDSALEGTAYSGPWVTDVTGEDVRHHYLSWEFEVKEILAVRVPRL